jgi:hypothetical protein
MAKVDTHVKLDDEVLRTVDSVAEELGHTREQVLEDSVRRGLAARSIGEVLARVRTRSDLSEDQATEVAYDEVKAVRAARRARRDSPKSSDDSAL